AIAPSPPYFNVDNDACGDLNGPLTQDGGALPGQEIGPVTVKCVDANNDGKVDIFHCETWNTPGQNTLCLSAADVMAGSPAKCNCGTLQGACIAVPDNNPCTLDVCKDTCSI